MSRVLSSDELRGMIGSHVPIYYCVDGDRYVGVLSAQVAASSTGEDRYSFIGTLFGDDYRSIKISNGKVGDFALPDDSLFALVL